MYKNYVENQKKEGKNMVNNLTNDQLKVIEISKAVISEVKKAVVGKDEIIIKVLLAVLAQGHILIDDIPGVGKTTLATALSKALSLNQKRLQFTPDVLPSDVTGFTVYNKQTASFDYKEGAAMCNLFMADEINRTSSKTQSALLEVMEEGKITVDGITRLTPKPYIVIATQNPIGSIGTQMLPESQLDRFIVKLSMGYPDVKSEVLMLKNKANKNPLDDVKSVADGEDILFCQQVVSDIYVSDDVYEYIARLVHATRNHEYIKLGVSPRGAIALTNMAKATALLRARDYVTPEDVLYILGDVISHRIILSSKAKLSSVTEDDVIKSIKAQCPPEKIN